MNWLRGFMQGRYGTDQLSIALMILSLILNIIARSSDIGVINFLSLAVFLVVCFRMFSKNIHARYNENQKFMTVYSPAKAWVLTRWHMLKSLRTHRFFKCPSCSQQLRVPRGKGTISIRCSRCNTSFIKKT